MHTRDLTRAGLGLALLICLAFVPPIAVGFLGVPIVLQNFGVMLLTRLLKPRQATAVIGLLLVLAALGLPFLSGGRGGFAIFAGPTAGFMFGWLLTPAMVWLFQRLSPAKNWWQRLWPLLIGGVLLPEIIGGAWLSLVTPLTLMPALLSVVVYLPGDAIKAVLASSIADQLQRTSRFK
ncbi:biotin transporter BioY [Lacticaseibacillus saniviri]